MRLAMVCRSLLVGLALAFTAETALAEAPDLPVLTSITLDPDLEPLRALLREEKTQDVHRLVREQLAALRDPDGADGARAADLMEIDLDAFLTEGESDPDSLRGIADRILELREQLFGSDDLRLIPSLWRRGWIDFQTGTVGAELTARMERALAIAEYRLGPEHVDLVDLLRAVGVCRRHANQDGAISALRRCIELGERTRGTTDHGVIVCVGTLSAVYSDQGDYEHSLALRSSAVQRLDQGGDLQGYWAITQVAGLVQELVSAGRFEEADRTMGYWYGRFERALGADNPHYGWFLALNGDRWLAMGDLTRTRKDYERALAILERNPSSFPSVLADLFLGLADLRLRLGDLSTAQELAGQALKEAELRLGPQSFSAYSGHMLLGRIQMENRSVDDAALHLETALRMEFSNPSYGAMTRMPPLVLLSAIEARRGNAELAARHRDLAVEILEGSSRENPYYTASWLNWSVYGAAFQLAGGAVIPVLERSAAVLEGVYGNESSPAGDLFATLAVLRLRQGDVEGARRDALRAETIGRAALRQVSSAMEERLALSYSATRPTGRDVLLSLAGMSADPRSVADAWHSLAASRAFVLDAFAARHRAASVASDRKTRDLQDSLAGARQRFAALSVRIAAGGTDPKLFSDVHEAQGQIDRLEHELGQDAAATKATMSDDSGLEQLLESLDHRVALVSYARYRNLSVTSDPPGDEYLAFVARASSGLRVVRLGSAASIDAAVAEWRSKVSDAPRGSRRARGFAEQSYKSSARRLYELIWAPLELNISELDTVFVVPDGRLHLVSLGTLPDRSDRYLVEHRAAIHYLGSERDLLRWPTRSQNRAATPEAVPQLIAIGGPAFDTAIHEASPGGTYRGARSACDDPAALSFSPLPAARREVEEIGSLWRQEGGEARTYSGARASEATVKRLAPQAEVLHVATHGVIWGEECPDASAGYGGSPLGPGRENPLRLSFLALAGANRREEIRDGEDGILTAEEIASLDLSKVRWAVLSACDTARGAVLEGEGVLGLRRAFAVAGAATTIMSLWSVEDEAARRWMVSLYRHRLAGSSTSDSVHQAGREVLRQRRARGLDTHPAHWGAFVAAGDWQ